MKRFDAINKIVKALSNELVVCNLGTPSRELYHIKDRERTFYMLGSMGLASSIAFGLSISKPDEKVLCIDGDGALLMNLGSLATIANNKPENLTLVVIDNSSYGSTGNQRTYTSDRTKLEIIAKGAGFESITFINSEDKIVTILNSLGKGCHFVLIKTQPGNAKVENIPLNPEKLKERFMKSFLIKT